MLGQRLIGSARTLPGGTRFDFEQAALIHKSVSRSSRAEYSSEEACMASNSALTFIGSDDSLVALFVARLPPL